MLPLPRLGLHEATDTAHSTGGKTAWLPEFQDLEGTWGCPEQQSWLESQADSVTEELDGTVRQGQGELFI